MATPRIVSLWRWLFFEDFILVIIRASALQLPRQKIQSVQISNPASNGAVERWCNLQIELTSRRFLYVLQIFSAIFRFKCSRAIGKWIFGRLAHISPLCIRGFSSGKSTTRNIANHWHCNRRQSYPTSARDKQPPERALGVWRWAQRSTWATLPANSIIHGPLSKTRADCARRWTWRLLCQVDLRHLGNELCCAFLRRAQGRCDIHGVG